MFVIETGSQSIQCTAIKFFDIDFTSKKKNYTWKSRRNMFFFLSCSSHPFGDHLIWSDWERIACVCMEAIFWSERSMNYVDMMLWWHPNAQINRMILTHTRHGNMGRQITTILPNYFIQIFYRFHFYGWCCRLHCCCCCCCFGCCWHSFFGFFFVFVVYVLFVHVVNINVCSPKWTYIFGIVVCTCARIPLTYMRINNALSGVWHSISLCRWNLSDYIILC